MIAPDNAVRRTIGLSVLLSLLSGCGGISSVAPSGTLGHQMRMISGASGIKRLLYVGNQGSGTVFMWNYDTGGFAGELNINFKKPYGICVDARGNVYVTGSAQGGEVVEFTHGALNPIKTLPAHGSPLGCSIDPTSGDLAVNSQIGVKAQVEVWKNGSGKPAHYSNNVQCSTMSGPPGYDDRGNLFMLTGTSGTGVCELRAGGTALEAVTIDRHLTQPSGSMWDGVHMTFTDNAFEGGKTAAVYQTKEEKNGKLTVIGVTQLKGRGCGFVPQAFIVGKKNTPANRVLGYAVVGGKPSCSGHRHHALVWSYPGGGEPFRKVDVAEPYGAAVSIAP